MARQTWAAGPFASAASIALSSLLLSLSLLPANKGQSDIPQGFGALGHLSAGVEPSEQLRKRRWSFRVDRPGTFRARSYQHAGQCCRVGKAGVDGLRFPRGRGGGEMPSSPSLSVKGSHTGNPWERSPPREDRGRGPGQLRAADLPAWGWGAFVSPSTGAPSLGGFGALQVWVPGAGTPQGLEGTNGHRASLPLRTGSLPGRWALGRRGRLIIRDCTALSGDPGHQSDSDGKEWT